MGAALTIVICITAFIGIVCCFTNFENNDISSSNILLGFLSVLIFIHFLVFHLTFESASSIINTYCQKNYSNNVKAYNECRYAHKNNFSNVILYGLK